MEELRSFTYLRVRIEDVGWRCRLTREILGVVISVKQVDEVVVNSHSLYITHETIRGISPSGLKRWILKNASTVKSMIYLRKSAIYSDILTLDSQSYILPGLRVIGCYPMLPVEVREGYAEYHVICINNIHENPIKFFIKLHKNRIKNIAIKQIDTIDLMDRSIEILGVTSPREISDKQLEIILTAYNTGYYDYPRKITLKDLSSRLGLSVATVSKILRSAEKKILNYYLRRSY